MRVITLGPSQSNHAWVLQQHKPQAEPLLVSDFDQGFAALLAQQAEHLLICTAHPDYARLVGQYQRLLTPIEAFVAASQPLSLCERQDCTRRQVDVMPATRFYADLSAYAQVNDQWPGVAQVGEALVQGQIEAGIVFSHLLSRHAEVLREVRPLGAPVDVWALIARSEQS